MYAVDYISIACSKHIAVGRYIVEYARAVCCCIYVKLLFTQTITSFKKPVFWDVTSCGSCKIRRF
jgi:hypothetical protein